MALFMRLDVIMEGCVTIFSARNMFVLLIVFLLLLYSAMLFFRITDQLSDQINYIGSCIGFIMALWFYRKVRCIKVRGRPSRFASWKPNPSAIITPVITAIVIGFLTLVIGVYYSVVLKPWLDRILPPSIATNLPPGQK
jgi:cytochrome c biogenesis protein CcdA